MDLSKIKTDKKKEAEGVWIQFQDDLELKIARLRNPAALAAFQEKTRFTRGQLPEKKMTELMNDVMAEHVLLDWRNLSIDGQAVIYSKEAALKVLQDFPAIAEFVAAEAARADNFLAEQTAAGIEAAKN